MKETAISYLDNSFKRLVALLISSRLLKVPSDPDILPEEDLPVLLQPVQHLLHVFLEEPEGESLVELDLLGVPLGLELPVVGKDLVDDGQDVTGALLVVGSRVGGLGRRSWLLQ